MITIISFIHITSLSYLFMPTNKEMITIGIGRVWLNEIKQRYTEIFNKNCEIDKKIIDNIDNKYEICINVNPLIIPNEFFPGAIAITLNNLSEKVVLYYKKILNRNFTDIENKIGMQDFIIKSRSNLYNHFTEYEYNNIYLKLGEKFFLHQNRLIFSRFISNILWILNGIILSILIKKIIKKQFISSLFILFYSINPTILENSGIFSSVNFVLTIDIIFIYIIIKYTKIYLYSDVISSIENFSYSLILALIAVISFFSAGIMSLFLLAISTIISISLMRGFFIINQKIYIDQNFIRKNNEIRIQNYIFFLKSMFTNLSSEDKNYDNKNFHSHFLSSKQEVKNSKCWFMFIFALILFLLFAWACYGFSLIPSSHKSIIGFIIKKENFYIPLSEFWIGIISRILAMSDVFWSSCQIGNMHMRCDVIQARIFTLISKCSIFLLFPFLLYLLYILINQSNQYYSFTFFSLSTIIIALVSLCLLSGRMKGGDETIQSIIYLLLNISIFTFLMILPLKQTIKEYFYTIIILTSFISTICIYPFYKNSNIHFPYIKILIEEDNIIHIK
ncbi:hypothetical protein [Lyticum sinuosum]|nr:hypothetical protein [Lyticum sinuosum]